MTGKSAPRISLLVSSELHDGDARRDFCSTVAHRLAARTSKSQLSRCDLLHVKKSLESKTPINGLPSFFFGQDICIFLNTSWERRAPDEFIAFLDLLTSARLSRSVGRAPERVVVMTFVEPHLFLNDGWSRQYSDAYVREAFGLLGVLEVEFFILEDPVEEEGVEVVLRSAFPNPVGLLECGGSEPRVV